ncbi:aminodeoxychorismate lyase [Rugamonas sp. CCM 8940]|uniref:aminodeoxychorismate lyase n=1 Tax=Rugamonas sp. CCM 8940 TaxID=2765359 RepID=UPI0018F7CF85|nr:aminodeoxychorismate lyase [Rugamonas sp. CCM 8940]MBJ7312892.1 aminodeoxychorismate lyase [Rugamonas sp. CCM 8940]
MELSFINGQAGHLLPVADRGLQYGDGLFETILCLDGAAQRFELHWERLRAGCARLAIALPEIRAELHAAIADAALPRAVAKLIVTRGSSARGYACPAAVAPNWILTIAAAPSPDPARYRDGIALMTCHTRLPHDRLLAGMKHLNRLHQVLARAELGEQVQDGVMLDQQGSVIEGVLSNLFLVQRGRVLTPDLSQCGVCGILRGEVMAACRTLGLALEVRAVAPHELLDADEVFVTNVLGGVVPVRSIDGRDIPRGPVARQLREQLCHQDALA